MPVGEAVKAKSHVQGRGHGRATGERCPNCLEAVKRIGGEFGFESVCYGHAGDGNLHVNILKDGVTDEFWETELSVAVREIFKEVRA